MRFKVVLAVALSIAGVAAAQERPAFDVAVIKTNASPDLRQSIVTEPGGRLVDRNVTLQHLSTRRTSSIRRPVARRAVMGHA